MVHHLDSLVGPRHRPLILALGAMLLSLSVLCVQLVLLQAGLVRAQGTLDVCSGCTYETIQEAIDAADPGDTIRVAQGVYTENLVVTRSLRLEGGYESSGWTRDIELYETTIDGNRSGSVISVTNGCSTTIDGFTITGGHADYGAGIFVQGSSVTVTNNVIQHNVAYPGQIPVEIREPLLAGDSNVFGIADPREATEVEVWDWTTSTHLGTGEIHADGTFGVWFLSPLTAGHHVRAIASYGWDEAVVQEGTSGSAAGLDPHLSGDHKILDLGQDGLAAAAGVNGVDLASIGERLHLTQAGGDEDGIPSTRGGGVYVLDSVAVVTGNLVVSNTARGFGGGIYAEGSTITLSGNEVEGNSSGSEPPLSWQEGFGGGVAVLSDCDFSVTDNRVAENVVLRGGGGIYVRDSLGSLTGNEIVANATDATGDECFWGFGGGAYIANSSPNIEGNDFLSNTLGSVLNPVQSCAFGGGLYLLGSSSVITGNRLAGNTVVVGASPDDSRFGAQGGGIFAAESQENPGTCVHNHVEALNLQLLIANNRVENNQVAGLGGPNTGTGGALSVQGASVELLDNEIIGNSAGFDGAGVLVFGSSGDGLQTSAVISGNLIMSNTLTAEPGHGGSGGVSLVLVSGTVGSNMIQGNVGGAHSGGLLLVDSSALVEDNNIVGNEGYCGGLTTLYKMGRGVVVKGNRIADNVGSGSAGGVEVWEGSIVLVDNAITGNTGTFGGLVAGGGWSDQARVTAYANWITENQATDTGGGITFWPDVAFTLTNNIVADNSAEGLGGGVYVSDSQGTLINNTIAENEEGAGEGIYLDGTASATILNNVIVSHTYGVYNAGSGAADVTYNDVWGDSVSDYYNVTPGTGNISSNPRFVDPENWDYHLWTTSPAVDAGHPDAGLAPSLDIDGDSRPMGSRVDMGADEVPFEVWVWKSDVPDPVLPGELVTYTIRLSNVSEESVGGLVMTDRVPVDTTLHWASDDYEETEGVVSWSIGSLGVGEQVTRTMVVETNEGLTDGTVINNGQYGADSEELTGPVMGTPVETRVGVPLLEISKTVYPDPVRSGGTLTYTLEVKNNGGIKATGVTISDRVPVNTVFSGASDGGEETDGVVTWSIAELGSGDSVERTMVVMVADGLADGTEIENVEYGVNCQEVSEGVTGPAVGTTVREPVVSIEKSDEPDPVLPGEELTYTIEVFNDGGWAAAGVVITDRIPADTTFHWASDAGELVGEVVSWTVGSLEPGNSVERTLVVTVSGGLSDNSVIDNDQYGMQSLDLGPVMGTPITTLVGLPMLTITKEVEPGLAFPGGEVEYSLTVHNEGHHVATGVVITDRVPMDTDFAWVLDGGELVGDEVRWTGLSLEPGESLTVHWGATVRENLLVGEIVNDSYGTRCSETSEVVMGEAVSTPLLRHRWWYPMVVKYAP